MGRPKIDTKPMTPMLNWEIQDTPSIVLPSEGQKLAMHDQLRRFRQQRRPNIAKLNQLPEVSATVESSDWECTKLMSCMRVYLLLLRAFKAKQEKLFIVEDNSSVYLTTLSLSFSLLLSICTISMIIAYLVSNVKLYCLFLDRSLSLKPSILTRSSSSPEALLSPR